MDDRPEHFSTAPPQPLPLARFESLIEAYGASPGRWPAADRAAALALLRQSEEARSLRRQAARLDAALDRLRPPLPSPDLASRLKRRGPAGARARLQRQRRSTRMLLPRVGPAFRYAAVALIAFIIGFAIAWALREDGGEPLSQSAPEQTGTAPSSRDGAGEAAIIPLN